MIWNVGKLYRQFLALLGGSIERTEKRLKEAAQERGALIWNLTRLPARLSEDFLHFLFLIRIQGLGLVLFDDLFDSGVEPLAQRGSPGFQPLRPSLAV